MELEIKTAEELVDPALEVANPDEPGAGATVAEAFKLGTRVCGGLLQGGH